MPRAYEIRIINGKPFKLCRGPMHREGAWISTDQFRKRSVGSKSMGVRLRGSCNRCEHFYRYPTIPPEQSGWVFLSNYRWAIVELENRVGRIEAARRAGISKTTWYRWRRGNTTKIQRRTAIALLTALHEAKKEKPRHRDSIKRGAYRRNERERIPYAPAA